MVATVQRVFRKSHPTNEWRSGNVGSEFHFEKKVVTVDNYSTPRKDIWWKRSANLPHIVPIAPRGKLNTIPLQIQNEFCSNALKWKEETKYSSSLQEIVLNKSYQRIIGLGPDVIPLILKDLKEYGGHWFWALNALTGENPVSAEDAGKIRRLTEAWLNWGRLKGYL